MATTSVTPNYERVTQGMRILQAALGPFIHRELSRVFGGKWYTEGVLPVVSEQTRRELPTTGVTKDVVNHLDVAALLSVMERRWGDAFAVKLAREARTYVNELILTRNKWAHIGSGDMEEDDAWRALDTMSRLLEAVKAPEAADIDKLAREVRQATYAASVASAPTIQAPLTPTPAPTQAAAVAAQAAMDFGLRSWREVITPHEDVAAGRYQQAEFAADLAQVLCGKAEPEYQDPADFFARTYLTEGMTNLLTAALRRLGGEGGEPVIQLKTAFGGGKTHTMLALYHLLRGRGKLDNLAGVHGMMEKAGVNHLPKASVAVLVGTALSPDRPQLDAGGHGIETRTLWGEMGAQLGGKEAYELVRSADEQSVAPGSNVLVELFDTYGPCVVLIDELVAYARNVYDVPNLPSGSFGSIMTFVQALTEASRRSKRSLVVAAIPESDMEAGGEAGRIALERIEHTFGRLETVWKPVAPQEGFEIVRRRLFSPVKEEAAKEQVCLGYSRLYSGDSADFPRQCGESTYLERLRAAYPIHPEVFDRLYDDWATLERFQKTRGVLRLMAACIHELWVRGDKSLLIQPGTLPLDAPRVKDELLRYLPDGWNTVMDRDVDGERSEPRRIDAENPRLGQLVAAGRVARSIFLGSAPHVVQQRVRGIEEVRIRLGVAQPGEPIAVFNDALGKLVDRLTYLYSGNHRYWYDTHPNLRRTAEDRASRFDAFEVAQEIEKRLRQTRDKGEFRGVHWFPDRTGSDVPDEQAARLVVLKPEHIYSRNTNTPEAVAFAAQILEQRGNSPRQYRNTLAFVAADADAAESLAREVRRYLAWDSIQGDRDELNLDAYQRKQAADQVKRADETVNLRLQEGYSWLLVPSQEPAGAWTWEITRLGAGEGTLVLRASRKMVSSEQLITKWSPALLRMELDRWLWKEQESLDTKRLWEYLCTYGYLPRLCDQDVLLGAIAEGARYKDYFGYASSVSASGKYEGLRFGEPTLPTSIHLDGVSVLVRPEAAQKQIDEEPGPAPGAAPGAQPSAASAAVPIPGPESGPIPTAPRMLRRYHGSAKLNPIRVGRDASTIAEEIIQQLAKLPGAQVEITLEIEADVPEGVPDDVVRTVTENGNTLKFTSQGFEEW